jgi:hypothetical protein
MWGLFGRSVLVVDISKCMKVVYGDGMLTPFGPFCARAPELEVLLAIRYDLNLKHYRHGIQDS